MKNTVKLYENHFVHLGILREDYIPIKKDYVDKQFKTTYMTRSNQFSDQNFKGTFRTQKETEERTPLEIAPLNDNKMNDLFSLNELLSAIIIRLSKNTAAGPDEIPMISFKQLPPNYLKHLLGTINIIYTEHVFPHTWQESTILSIHKNHKPTLGIF
ncbi:hypothetical protein HHI36_005324 [Cryptolaemus montrouzieri]|uniref:Uncharacterized protein n=1 Tax=Cryptolaemus montrouzieri TaxID=559131 RepID=A0ABD2NTS3_9CUCU